MRRKHLATTLLILPLANAFSLANFQEITSVLIPKSCVLSYNSQIPTCTLDDFNTGCSKPCRKALKKVAEDISEACAGVILNPKSLLGIVKAGGIVNALCLPEKQTTTTMEQPTQSPAPIQSQSQPSPPETETEISVTLPTKSPGVSVTKSATSTTSVASATRETTVAETSEASSAPPSTTATPTMVAPSTITVPPSTAASQATSTSTTATQPSREESGGGGSPFDIVSSANHIERHSILSLFLAAGAILLFGR